MHPRFVFAVLAAAGVVGGMVGFGSVANTRSGRIAVSATARDLAVATGMKRAREPQPGDRWGGCHDARAMGTAPIYRGEPGYREDMDGDGDGIACEPAP